MHGGGEIHGRNADAADLLPAGGLMSPYSCCMGCCGDDPHSLLVVLLVVAHVSRQMKHLAATFQRLSSFASLLGPLLELFASLASPTCPVLIMTLSPRSVSSSLSLFLFHGLQPAIHFYQSLTLLEHSLVTLIVSPTFIHSFKQSRPGWRKTFTNNYPYSKFSRLQTEQT